MSIQNKRIALLTEQILKRNLQQGILPNSREFVWQLNQALRQSGASEPSFTFQAYRNTAVASSDRLNEDNETIYRDLSILYQNVLFVHQLLNRHHQYFSVEKERLEKEIDILENRIRQYVSNANRTGLLPYVYDTFDSTEKTDLEETSKVFVDTKNNAVHLVEERNSSVRIVPNGNIRFNFEPVGLLKKEELLTGNLNHLLSDKQDEVWQKQILLKENLSVTGQFEISFEQSQNLNHIEIESLTVRPYHLQISFTPDGNEWYYLPYHEAGVEVSKRIALDFPGIGMKKIRLTIQKKESDTSLPEEDGFNYQYLFGFQEISFYSKQYPSVGTFCSKPLSLLHTPENYAIDTVQLIADESIPTGTAIQYEIALLGENGWDWQRIDPKGRRNPEAPQQLKFSRLRKNEGETLFFPEEFSIRQSEAEDLRKNGIPLYRLSSLRNSKTFLELPKIKMLSGRTKLYVGKGTWEVQSFPDEQTDSVPKLEEFKSIRDGRTVEYVQIGDARTGEFFKNRTDNQKRKYLARTGFYLEEPLSLRTIPLSSEPVAIYSNGELLFEGTTETSRTLSLSLPAGWNELVVLVSGKNATSVNGMTVGLGFNLKQYTENAYASSTPLSEVSLFDLQYNTKINDRSVFAKRETETGLEILTNFGQPGLSFELRYEYRDDFETDETIRLRATLLRENGETVPTPVLRSYRLEFS